MVIIPKPSEIENYIGKPLTPSDWYHVTQKKINEFADATSDHQWIHVDEGRAKTDILCCLYYQNYLLKMLKYKTLQEH